MRGKAGASNRMAPYDGGFSPRTNARTSVCSFAAPDSVESPGTTRAPCQRHRDPAPNDIGRRVARALSLARRDADTKREAPASPSRRMDRKGATSMRRCPIAIAHPRPSITRQSRTHENRSGVVAEILRLVGPLRDEQTEVEARRCAQLGSRASLQERLAIRHHSWRSGRSSVCTRA